MGPMGPVGEQGTAGDDAYTGVLRIAGHLDTYGRATCTTEQTGASPDYMPLVNVWVRRCASDPYKLVTTSELCAWSDGCAEISIHHSTTTKQFWIRLFLPEFAGAQYVLVIVFYPESVPYSRPAVLTKIAR